MPTKSKEIATTQFVMTLKREGKGACHFVTGTETEAPEFIKDAYVPKDRYTALGSPKEITVTVRGGR